MVRQKMTPLRQDLDTSAISFTKPSICCAVKVTTIAFLGVGAPEAVLVGVVALIVFGPKGLAEVRNNIFHVLFLNIITS